MRFGLCSNLACVVGLSTLPYSSCAAIEYRIEFASWPHSNSLYVDIVRYNFSDPASPRFRDWGSSWTPSEDEGSKITNRHEDRKTFVSVHFKIADTSDTFDIDASSVGSLFTEAWIRRENGNVVEAVFSGASVPRGSSFWMLVEPGTPDNPYENFKGYWSDKLISPSGADWEKIYPVRGATENRPTDVWRALIAACPNKYRRISAYALSEDEKTVAFLSRGRLFIFDYGTKKIYAPPLPIAIPRGVNRLTFSEDKSGRNVTIWVSGDTIAQVRIVGNDSDEVIGIVPQQVEMSD